MSVIPHHIEGVYVTVPPGLRYQPADRRAHFETLEPIEQLPSLEPLEPVDEREERQDIAIIGPIAAVVLALTVCTLVLDHPSARVVAAGLATLGLIIAVVLLLIGKRPKPGSHRARHAIER